MSIAIYPLQTRSTQHVYIDKITKKKIDRDLANKLENACSIKNYDKRSIVTRNFLNSNVSKQYSDDTISELCTRIFDNFETVGEFKNFVNSLNEDKKNTLIELMILSGVLIVGYNLFSVPQTSLPAKILETVTEPMFRGQLALPVGTFEQVVPQVSQSVLSNVSNKFMSSISSGLALGSAALSKVYNVLTTTDGGKYTTNTNANIDYFNNQPIEIVHAAPAEVNKIFNGKLTEDLIKNQKAEDRTIAEEKLNKFIQENLNNNNVADKYDELKNQFNKIKNKKAESQILSKTPEDLTNQNQITEPKETSNTNTPDQLNVQNLIDAARSKISIGRSKSRKNNKK